MSKGGSSNNSGLKAQAKAMVEQARASVKAADISAAAARDVAEAELKGMTLQANASMFAAQQSAMGGVIGAALGANTTTEQIKQWLPHESGAATIASWDLAEKWNKTISMREQGYSDVAIDYALSGNNYKSLYKDPQFNSMTMMKKMKEDGMAAISAFGIKSPSNPHGLDLSEEDFIKAHTLKDPMEAMKVDPIQAAARQKAFISWEAQMRAKGLGLLVDIYKNPQLAGSHLKAMQGKEALLDPSLAPLVKSMMQDPSRDSEGNPLDPSNHDWGNPKTGKLTNHQGMPINQGTDWDAVIRSLTQGEQNPMTAQVEKLKEMGVIDKYGMVQAGSILQHIPPELRDPIAFNPFYEIDDKQIMYLKDMYRKYSEMNVDPKLVQEQSLGYGVTRKVKLNADGSIAATTMEGMMTDMQGNQIYMAVNGNRLQEWYDRQSMISGMGPLFPGMMAPSTDEERNGTFEPGFWGKNQLAQPNQGSNKPNTPIGSKSTDPYKSSAPSSTAAPKPSSAPTQSSNPASSAGGAPLAAGE